MADDTTKTSTPKQNSSRSGSNKSARRSEPTLVITPGEPVDKPGARRRRLEHTISLKHRINDAIALGEESLRMSGTQVITHRDVGVRMGLKSATTADPNKFFKTVDSWAFDLREELRALRNQKGYAPVRRKVAISKAEIAEEAMYLLERSVPPALRGGHVISLMRELLEVDRRRNTMADRLRKGFLRVMIEARKAHKSGEKISIRELAKRAKVAHSTLAEWQQSESYKYWLDKFKMAAGPPEVMPSLQALAAQIS